MLRPADNLTCYQQMLPRVQLQTQVCHDQAASGRYRAELLQAQERGLGAAAGATGWGTWQVGNRC